jgi:Fe(3+) dicitrate transport protein
MTLPAAEIVATVTDQSGARIPRAEATLKSTVTGLEVTTYADDEGRVRYPSIPAGSYRLRIGAAGFTPVEKLVRLEGDLAEVDFQLAAATIAQEVQVSAGQIAGTPTELSRLPGSVGFISNGTLQESRVFNTDEALRKVSGVHARSEEGFGLRPNIGIRGLSPTRSTKLLLLEDGIPLSYAPYGDNASYYHPPIDRFDSVEILKGSGQIQHGPMTVGGVINYITPAAPAKKGGEVMLLGGNRGYLNAHGRYGGTFGRTGLLFDFMRKQGDGSRENTSHELTDWNAKSVTALNDRHTVGLRFNYYKEDSNLTYTGLRQDEWDRNPRGNPFRNDYFFINRYAAAVTHTWAISPNVVMSNAAYSAIFLRDWWRQSSNSAQRPNDSSDPACAGMQNLNTTCGNEGRVRSYYTWGIDPKFKAMHRLFGVRSEADFGVRYHNETQIRIQKNGPLPTSRDGRIVEDNDRRARAGSAFFQNRFLIGRFAITPGLRYEAVNFRRTNFLAATPVTGRQEVRQWIPGLGVAYNANDVFTVFAGVHRGFAPPRVEDVINNNTGQSIDLDAELSWNYEAGFRGRVARDLQLEAAWFRMDFENQIIPSSVAGGVGATLTNAGRTLHQGGEISGRWTTRVAPLAGRIALRGAYTYLPDASFRGTRFSAVNGAVLITGNRLPYAPRNLLNASLHYFHNKGFNAMVESVTTGRQFGDDLNTVNGTADGQRGAIPGNTLWNATANYPIEAWRTTLFVTAKNLTDRLAIVDRSRGLLPAMPRLVQAGFRFTF